MAKKVVKKAPPKLKRQAPKYSGQAPKYSGQAKTPKAALQKKDSAPKTPRKDGYSQQELARFKEIILQKKKEILEELENLKESMMDVTTGEYVSENSTYSLHMEQGTDAMEREKTFLFASREGKFLNYLEDALKRIEKGDYGHCVDCGKLIEKERLEAVPHAQLCVQCKTKRGR
jgi:RNA polymerase-binding protein DksA